MTSKQTSPKKNLISKENINRLCRYGAMAFVVFCVIFFFTRTNYYVIKSGGAVTGFRYRRIAVTLAVLIATWVVLFCKNRLSDKANRIGAIAWFCISPGMMFLSLEYLNKALFQTRVQDMEPFYIFLNLVIYYVILLFFFAVTGSVKISSVALCGVICFFGLLNYYVYDFRSLCIVASDLYSIRTAASVAGNYSLFMNFSIFSMIILTFLVMVVSCKFRSFRCFKWKGRLIFAGGWLVAFYVFVQVYIFSGQLFAWGVDVKLYMPQNRYRFYGTVLTTVGSSRYLLVDKPEGYTTEEVKKIADPYLDGDDRDTGKRPNVIVIMDEAFSDLYTVGKLKTNEDYMPFIHSLKENTIKGTAYVSVFGGNTADSEFEFLTGNSMAFLTTNSIPYQLFIKDKFPNLTYKLESSGYSPAIAVHPYLDTGFSRKKVYPLFGFDDFLSTSSGSFVGAQKLRGYVTDQADFEKIIDEYEQAKKKSDNPFYLFNVTMQNHGGYDTGLDEVGDKIKFSDGYKNKWAQLYINLAHKTDEAFSNLLAYFEQVNEPTVIVFFGDHQPGIGDKFYGKLMGKAVGTLTTKELVERYKVPFVIWGNYDIPEEEIDRISLNYLSAYMSEKVGLPLTGYDKYLLALHEKVPAINSLGYWGDDGNFYESGDKTSPYASLLQEYNILEYNNLLDRKNRYSDFFYLEPKTSGWTKDRGVNLQWSQDS